MKKKWLSLGVPAVAGAMLMLVSGFSVSAGTSGYEVYKEALKTNANVKSVTADVQISVTDNGQETVKAQANLKLDKDRNAANGSVSLGGGGTEPRTLNVFHQGKQVVVKNGTDDVYYVVEPQDGDRRFGHKFKGQGQGEGGPPKEFENVIDALVGNLKQQIEVDQQADGSKQVSLHLTGSQIPAVANAVGSLLVKQAGSADKFGDETQQGDQDVSMAKRLLGGDWKPQLPELTQDVRIEAVNVDAVIGKDNHIQQQTVQISVGGKDEAGDVHEVSVTVDANFSAFDSTTSDNVDLSGKKVETIQTEGWNGKRHP
ncbi:hypothetical protein [Paenibacillus nasutitermitis]|uniref:Uncharacterized protein n=1 Tax=Paenibacillus nasutitermitis TaxID=1652958 RepID=A0A916YUG2_9BACL|nr:hypothetical protein [Paenibacillus nasutitermitis]GGD62451.1 hypothetical protein GCM10010911_20440 [Paenibacillus nasutitermitis]